jgi:hypothetical protein
MGACASADPVDDDDGSKKNRPQSLRISNDTTFKIRCTLTAREIVREANAEYGAKVGVSYVVDAGANYNQRRGEAVAAAKPQSFTVLAGKSCEASVEEQQSYLTIHLMETNEQLPDPSAEPVLLNKLINLSLNPRFDSEFKVTADILGIQTPENTEGLEQVYTTHKSKYSEGSTHGGVLQDGQYKGWEVVKIIPVEKDEAILWLQETEGKKIQRNAQGLPYRQAEASGLFAGGDLCTPAFPPGGRQLSKYTGPAWTTTAEANTVTLAVLKEGNVGTPLQKEKARPLPAATNTTVDELES